MATRYGWMADTSSEAFEALIELQRRMSPGDKLAAMFELTAMMMRLSEDAVRKQFPNASDREVFLRAATRRLGRDIMIKAYGWDPLSRDPPE